jgi:hypothetical protein
MSPVVTMSLLRRIISSWPLVAFGLLMVGVGVSAWQGRPSAVYYGAVLAAGGVAAVGFTAWIIPWLRPIWRSTLGKFVLTWLHGIVLAVTFGWAQALVAQALELPPHDFDATIGVCAAVLWPIVWVHIMSVAVGVFALVLLIASGVTMLLNTLLTLGIWDMLIDFLKATFPTETARLRQMIDRGRSTSAALAWYGLGRAFAAFMLVFVGAVAEEQYPHVVPYLTPIVRGIAYLADYQPLPRYPGIDGTRRARVHENGVVSYAEDQRWTIIITVDTVRPPPSSDLPEGVQQ